MPATVSVDVDVAPRVVERVPVGAAVAGRAAVVGAQHRPPTRHEVPDPGVPVDRRLVGRPTVHVDEQRAAARPSARPRPPGAGGSQSSPCTVSPSAPGHVIGLGSGRSWASSSAGAPRRRTSRRTGCRVEHRHLRRGAPARPDARDARADPSRGRGASPWTRRSAASSSASATTTRRPKPSSLRRARSRAPSGDHANDRWPGPHVGSAWSCASAEHARRCVADAGDAPHVPPTVGVRDVRERAPSARTAAGRPRRRRRRRRPPARRRGRRRERDDARAVPRHRREVPLVPGERAAVGGPRRVPREVGVRHALRPAPPSSVDDRDVAGVVASTHERDPARRARPRARRRGRRATSTRAGPPAPGPRRDGRRPRRRRARRRRPSTTRRRRRRRRGHRRPRR